MANYLYKTVLYTDASNVADLSASNATDLSEYTTNHQSSTVKIDNIELADTTFEVEKTYSNFDSMITDGIDWTDVKELTKDNRYELYLVTSEPM